MTNKFEDSDNSPIILPSSPEFIEVPEEGYPMVFNPGHGKDLKKIPGLVLPEHLRQINYKSPPGIDKKFALKTNPIQDCLVIKEERLKEFSKESPFYFALICYVIATQLNTLALPTKLSFVETALKEISLNQADAAQIENLSILLDNLETAISYMNRQIQAANLYFGHMLSFLNSMSNKEKLAWLRTSFDEGSNFTSVLRTYGAGRTVQDALDVLKKSLDTSIVGLKSIKSDIAKNTQLITLLTQEDVEAPQVKMTGFRHSLKNLINSLRDQ